MCPLTARTLQQSVEGQSEDGRQQGGATANQDGGAAQAQAVGTRSARASTAVVSNSAGETVAAFEASGDNSEGSCQAKSFRQPKMHVCC